MRAILRTGLLCFAFSILGTATLAQEGHPLKGSWIGTWEGNETHNDFVLIILNWDGDKITGMINPGTDNIEISEASLDPQDWSIHIEAEAELESGRSITYELDGTIEELALPNRYITGTWRSENGSGELEIRRQ